jgi:hypothetical protein
VKSPHCHRPRYASDAPDGPAGDGVAGAAAAILPGARAPFVMRDADVLNDTMHLMFRRIFVALHLDHRAASRSIMVCV